MAYDEFRAFLDQMEEDGYDLDEALNEWAEIQEERHRRFIEDYESRADVQYGWYQEDMIDLRYRER